eukprot:Gb_02148 [translate_table: standard]
MSHCSSLSQPGIAIATRMFPPWVRILSWIGQGALSQLEHGCVFLSWVPLSILGQSGSGKTARTSPSWSCFPSWSHLRPWIREGALLWPRPGCAILLGHFFLLDQVREHFLTRE